LKIWTILLISYGLVHGLVTSNVSCLDVYEGTESYQISLKRLSLVIQRWTKVFRTTWGWV